MKLHLIRHAKTEKIASSGKDFDRSLMDRGRSDAKNLALYLKSLNFQADKALCSSAKRTRETCSILQNEVDLGTLFFLDQLYLANQEVLRDIIGQYKTEENLLIIGHNDGISELASYLTGQDLSLSTSAYVCVEFFIDEWKEISQDTGMIIDFYRPQEIS